MLFNARKRLANTYAHPNFFKFQRGDWKAGLNVKTFEANKSTVSGGITETITNLIPAGCLLLGMVGKVTVGIVGAGLTTFSVGIATDTDRFATGLAKAAGTTFGLADVGAHTSLLLYPAATSVTLTGDAGVFTTGTVHIVGYYIDLDPLITM